MQLLSFPFYFLSGSVIKKHTSYLVFVAGAGSLARAFDKSPENTK